MVKFLWTLEKIELLSEIYKEKAKQEPKRKKEFEEKSTALNMLVKVLRQIPEERRKMGFLAEFLTQVNEEVNPTKRWFSFSAKKNLIPLSVFTEKITLFQQLREQQEAQIAAK